MDNETIKPETEQELGGRFDSVVMPEDEIIIFNPQLSVFKGEVAFLTLTVDNPDGGNPIEVGKLWGTGGKLSFEGDVEESARIFFDAVIECYTKANEDNITLGVNGD